jgi:hypothetical protein
VSDTFTNTILAAAISAVVGVCAWIGTNFLVDPLLEFGRRRRAIHESLFFTANVANFSKAEAIENAEVELRRHAAALDALWATASFPVKKWLLWRGYDVKNAAANLTGFSNSLRLEDGEKAIHRNLIEKGLRYARSYTDEEMQGIIRARREHRRPG